MRSEGYGSWVCVGVRVGVCVGVGVGVCVCVCGCVCVGVSVCLCLSVSVSVCLCLSVTQHLTSRTFIRLTNDMTYLTGDEGQILCGVFSENAPLQS